MFITFLSSYDAVGIKSSARRTSEGFCPVPLLGCDECWDQQVELPGGTQQGVKGLISFFSVSAADLMNNHTFCTTPPPPQFS